MIKDFQHKLINKFTQLSNTSDYILEHMNN